MFGALARIPERVDPGMAAIPGDLETDRQPPMTVPLRHFVVAFAFLVGGAGLGLGQVAGVAPGQASLAHVHLLLAGWICITIMGAMTQFVPVWSGTAIHSRRLATAQLTLVVVGLGGFAAALLVGALSWLVLFGGLMVAGFWTFAYNVGRTLLTLDELDVTERHFAVALLFFIVLTAFGYLLAVDLTHPVLAAFSIPRTQLVGAHATLAVFGAILTTIYGALYQLGTMFTQTELHGIDHPLKTVEEIGHPTGVVLLASGRFLEATIVAQVGGVLVVVAALAFSGILGRKLSEMRVEWTPMHTRYTVVAPALAGWAVLTLPAWFTAPTASAHRFGGPEAAHLLLLGVVGFVVLGTVYHIVPFIVWVHRYSDLLGFEDVPMIDDLYSDRLAMLDFVLLFGGTLLLVGADLLALGLLVTAAGGTLVSLGALVFITNMVLVLRTHSPHPLDVILLGSLSPRPDRTGDDAETESAVPEQ
jgi:hypothetical protein